MTTDALDRAIRRAALDRATWETFASDAKRSLLVGAFLRACDDRTLLAGECERLYAHLDRLAASADEGFRAVDDGEPASYVYQWTRNMAYAIRHPESPMGDALTATTRGEGDES